MAIVKIDKENGQVSYHYDDPGRDLLYDMASELLETVKEYVNLIKDLGYKELSCNFSLLLESIVRVDKRKDYFMIFHDDTDINENRISALQAYWIVKFKPFSIRSLELSKKYPCINELIAAFLILSTVKEVAEQGNPSNFRISKQFVRKLHYALKYWDLSKESLMLVVEALSE